MDPYAEWVVIGRELVRKNSEATLWDLLCIMYAYKTGHSVPEMPREEEVISLHASGWSTKEIAKVLESDKETVSIILKSVGFCPFTKSLSAGLSAVLYDPKTYPVTPHIMKKVILELEKLQEYVA